MFKNYGEFIKELEDTYTNIIQFIAPIGIELDNRLINGNRDEIIIQSRDILKRLVSNIRVLKGIKISDDTCVAYRLILRASTADLIECFYLLLLSEENRNQEIWKRNLECVRTLKLYATEKKKFYEKFDKDKMEDIDLSLMNERYTEYVDPITQEFFSKNKNRKCPTGDMIKNLVKEKLCSPEFEQLYINYRLLSLTEHYTTLGRTYSFNNPFDHYIIIDIVRWIFLVTTYICKGLKEYLETGNLTVEKIE